MWACVVNELWLVYYFGYIGFLGIDTLLALRGYVISQLSYLTGFDFFRIALRHTDEKNQNYVSGIQDSLSLLGNERETNKDDSF